MNKTHEIKSLCELPDGWEFSHFCNGWKAGQANLCRHANGEPYANVADYDVPNGGAMCIILRRVEPDAVKLARLAIPLLKSVGINTVLFSKAQTQAIEAVEIGERIIAAHEGKS